MIYSSRGLLLFLTIGVVGFASVPARAVQPDVEVDWAKFLGRHDMVWTNLPGVWDDAAFLGNGLLGATVYSESGTNALEWDVGRSDVVNNGARVAIGRFVLVPEDKSLTNGTMRLDLWNAEARGNLRSDKSALGWRSFTHSERLFTAIELNGAPAKLVFQHRPLSDSRADAQARGAAAARPDTSSQGETNGVQWCLQSFGNNGGYVVAWAEKAAGKNGARLFFFTVDFVKTGPPAVDKAVALIRGALDSNFNSLVKSHRDWWHAYYPRSFLSVPNTRMEGFYWAQMYKLASGTRADRPALDLLGPWFRTTGWPRIWWNLNIQLTYWPVYTANRLDLGESLTRLIDSHVTNLINNVPEEWRYDSAGIGRSSSYDCVRSVAGPDATSGTLEHGDLTWALHNYWLQYRYSGDEEMLRERLYPILKRAAGYYLHLLTPGQDGKLHMPLSLSPEYPNPNGGGNALVHDANFDLSLIRWALRTLLAANQRFHLNDPLAVKWTDTLDRLAPFPVNENGFMIGADMPFAVSHRHFSHLFMIYPLHLLDPQSAADRPLIEKSIAHWQSMPAALRGYSFSGSSAMYSWLGQGNDAERQLDVLLSPVDGAARNRNQHVRWNTMYTEGSPVIETPLSGAASIHEMLLQSWSQETFGTHIRVFPAVPDHWKDASFAKLLAEGAFEVSAVRRDGKTRFVEIKSLAGAPCRVTTGLAEPIAASGRHKVTTDNDADGRRVTTIDLRKGETVLLMSAADRTPLLASPFVRLGELTHLTSRRYAISPVAAQPEWLNYYGSPKTAKTTTVTNAPSAAASR